jgi:hypothetical protein
VNCDKRMLHCEGQRIGTPIFCYPCCKLAAQWPVLSQTAGVVLVPALSVHRGAGPSPPGAGSESKGGTVLSLGRQRRGNFRNVVTPFVGHDDTPNVAAPPFQGSRYRRRLPPSGGVVGQDEPRLSAIRSPPRPTSRWKKIPRHGVGHLSAHSQRHLSNAADTDRTGCRRAQIDDPSTHERPAVIDAHHHGASGVPVGNGDPCSKR